MDIVFVEFALLKSDPVRVFLLSEEAYTRWCGCEPQEGYSRFKVIKFVENIDIDPNMYIHRTVII